MPRREQARSRANRRKRKNVTPIQWLGGKGRAIKIITPHFPSGLTEMMSPFIGGGSIEVHMAAKGARVHAYDGDNIVAGFWEFALRSAPQLHHAARAFWPIDSTERLNALRARMLTLPNNLERAALHLVIVRSAYSALVVGGSIGYTRPFTRSSLWKLHGLDAPSLSVGWAHYRESLRRHPEMFAYLDPPYLFEDGRNYYRPDFDHNDFFEAIKDRPNWIQSNTDNQLVRDMYAGFRIESVEWKYGGSHTKGETRCESSEVLIFSRDP